MGLAKPLIRVVDDKSFKPSETPAWLDQWNGCRFGGLAARPWQLRVARLSDIPGPIQLEVQAFARVRTHPGSELPGNRPRVLSR